MSEESEFMQENWSIRTMLKQMCQSMSENGLRTQVMHKALKKLCRQLSAIMLYLDPKGLRKETPKVTKKSEDNAEPPCEVKNIPLVKSESVLSSMDRNAESCQPFLIIL